MVIVEPIGAGASRDQSMFPSTSLAVRKGEVWAHRRSRRSERARELQCRSRSPAARCPLPMIRQSDAPFGRVSGCCTPSKPARGARGWGKRGMMWRGDRWRCEKGESPKTEHRRKRTVSLKAQARRENGRLGFCLSKRRILLYEAIHTRGKSREPRQAEWSGSVVEEDDG